MSNYAELRKRIRGAVAPVPIFLRADDSLDHDGLARYTDWLLNQGVKNLCLTFTYSTLDMITTAEIVEVTRTVAQVVADRGVFISCTNGGPLREAIKTVQGIQEAGAHATFVHVTEFMLQNNHSGGLYVNYLRAVAREVDVPFLCCALPDPWQSSAPMLTDPHYDELVQDENFIGLKDDLYQLAVRKRLIQRFGDRLCIIGGGDRQQYLQVHRFANQSEFAGHLCPQRDLRFFELLDNNHYAAALDMIDEDSQTQFLPPGLHWLAGTLVLLYALGFSETYRVRPPLVSATHEQAQSIIAHMRKHPTLYPPIHGSLLVDAAR